MNNDEQPPSVPTARGEGGKEEVRLLKTLEDMLRNRIQKKEEEEVHKTKNIAENDRLSIEINTLHWVIA
jgi:hypothetical protein